MWGKSLVVDSPLCIVDSPHSIGYVQGINKYDSISGQQNQRFAEMIGLFIIPFRAKLKSLLTITEVFCNPFERQPDEAVN